MSPGESRKPTAAEKFDVIIVGGGPGGLSCARTLAEAGARVVLLERKKNIGRKVCGGGITWDGLIRKLPKDLLERTFTRQHIYSNHQKINFSKKDPIIATVNRETLGRWMTDKAAQAGARIRTGCMVKAIHDRSVTVTDSEGSSFNLQFDHLVGADGSGSAVRRFLNIPTVRMGLGINYQIPGQYKRMEWHLNTKMFGNGYSWIFPHRDSVSIGAYQPLQKKIPPARLKKQLVEWAATRGFDLEKIQARAELINYDYRGFQFGNKWLVGDAAGMASGLTGEGINPAIISGKAVARLIVDPEYPADELSKMIRKQHQHREIVDLSGGSKTVCTLLMESLVLMLRLRLVNFQKQLSMS